MRFEIKSGGAFLILVGLAALSGAVFALGLMAGYQIATQNPANAPQVAAAYPLPSPMEEPSPAASPQAALASAPQYSPAPLAAPPVATPAPVAPPPPKPAQVAVKPPLPPPPKPEAEHLNIEEPNTKPATQPKMASRVTPPDTERTMRASEPASARRAFHIEVEAAMDYNSAEQLATKIRTLGYNPQIVPSDVNGQTWYKVQVGPYGSEEEAEAADITLRQRYQQKFAH